MFIAVDDTDSREGMCTTYVLSEIIKRSGLDLIGLPGLVRLNPAIKHKTRGNGALIANLGHGEGEATKAGFFGNEDVLNYPKGESVSNGKDLMKLAGEVVSEMAELDEPETNPGIVVSERKFDQAFYWRAVREEIDIGEAENFITEQGGSFLKVKNGRGIIGSAAALSWPGNNVTFEILNYKYPNGTTLDPEKKILAAKMAENIQGTFNNLDIRNGYSAIFPKERTPVVFGVRGTNHNSLIRGVEDIIYAHSLDIERSILYVTNQATDDHIINDPVNIRPGSSYSLEGRITCNAYNIEGGHYFSFLKSGNMEIKIAAFEPTKEFRNTFSKLMTGDKVRVYGTLRDNCLNVEKMEIIDLVKIFVRLPPKCTKCGGNMRSKGHNDYRCPDCGHRTSTPSFVVEKRDIRTGFYDVPVIARRHLSRPFDLEMSVEEVRKQEVVN